MRQGFYSGDGLDARAVEGETGKVVSAENGEALATTECAVYLEPAEIAAVVRLLTQIEMWETFGERLSSEDEVKAAQSAFAKLKAVR